MKRSGPEKATWFDGLTERFSATRRVTAIDAVADNQARTVLVARVRWILLILIGCYALIACSLYSSSRYGFFLSPTQLALLIFTLVSVICYNLVFQYHLFFESVVGFRYRNRLQIFLDILFVTILVHLSGGAASWFWPVYLIVTIESAFLLKRSHNVFIMGGLGSLVYGALLIAEYLGLIPHSEMPFVNDMLYHDPLFQLLIWVWVTIVNATVAIISVFLMNVLRLENRALRTSEERLMDFIDTTGDLISSMTPDGKILYSNRAWQTAIGGNSQEMTQLLWESVPPEKKGEWLFAFERLARGELVNPFNVELLARDGRRIPVEGTLTCSFRDGEVAAIWGICRDVSDRKRAEDKLFWLAHHDAVTGLPNRTLFIDRLKQARAMAKRTKTRLAVLFLDLDRFKIINDTLGHDVGDNILRGVAERLRGCLRETDTIARFGGDEYTIILVDIRESADVERIARKILGILKEPFWIDGHELRLTTSIGISLCPSDGDDCDLLVKNADLAMYHAKSMGRNNFQFYAREMNENCVRKLALANSLPKALEREEFILHYQPKFNIATGMITSLEALIRWRHPDMGLVCPEDFVPIAEETGLIIPLGEWVIREACRQNRAWQDRGFPPIRIAVNLSPYQFKQKGLVDSISRILETTGVNAELLEIEITESVIMQNPDRAAETLREMTARGLHISIDDFGTGYSSLAQLKRFSINTLKIDKSFIRDVEINQTDAAITSAIIAMGKSLNLGVIAEGVETEGQLAFLKENRCTEGQGFLFSVPLPADRIPELICSDQNAAWCQTFPGQPISGPTY